MLRFSGYLLRFHLASDWARNNQHSRNFLWCSRFYGNDCNFGIRLRHMKTENSRLFAIRCSGFSDTQKCMKITWTWWSNVLVSKIQSLPESWNLDGNIFFELFLSDLDEKQWLRRATNETAKLAYQIDNYSPRSVSHAKRKYSSTLDNFSLSKWSHIILIIRANFLTSISERFWPNFDRQTLQTNIPPRSTAISFALRFLI